MDRAEKIVWNPFSKGYFDNPYPHLAECRETKPIQLGIHNAWTFFRYEDVSRILRAKDEYDVSDLPGYFKEKEDYIFGGEKSCPHLTTNHDLWPLYKNDDLLKDLRVILGSIFNKIDFRSIAEESIEVVNQHFQGSQSIDVAEYSGRYIYEILKRGFDLHEFTYEELAHYSNMLAVSQDIYVPKQVYKEINDSIERFSTKGQDSEFVQQIREQLRIRGMSDSPQSVQSLVSVSIMAAFETSIDNLTTGLIEILRKDDLIAFLNDSDERQTNMLIEEIFRVSSPLQFTIRVNKNPISKNENIIPAGSKLYLSIASANRDPFAFENPDEVMPERTPNNHLSFSAGQHFCLGANIARTELRVCLKPMISFLKGYQVDFSSLRWTKQIFMRHLKQGIVHKS